MAAATDFMFAFIPLICIFFTCHCFHVCLYTSHLHILYMPLLSGTHLYISFAYSSHATAFRFAFITLICIFSTCHCFQVCIYTSHLHILYMPLLSGLHYISHLHILYMPLLSGLPLSPTVLFKVLLPVTMLCLFVHQFVSCNLASFKRSITLHSPLIYVGSIAYAPIPLCRIYCRMRMNVKSKKFAPVLLCLKGQMHKVIFESTKIVRTLLSST